MDGGPRKRGEPGIDVSSCLHQVNQTFQDLALLRDVQEVSGVLGPQLFNFMNDSANVVIPQVGPGWRAADLPRASPVTSPPSEK